VVERILAIRQFCEKIGDDPSLTVKAVLDAMPDEISEAVRERLML
jgi:hypothetical protein